MSEASSATLADLPITEVPANADGGDQFAVLLSGDGGWAGIDAAVAAALAARGIPVVGLDSLRYFWNPRTPEGLAADLDRVIRHYAGAWHRRRVLLVGYSQGADVLPFAINRLAPDTRALVRAITLMALSRSATFEFHFSNWVGNSGDREVAPEAAQLPAATTQCVYGVDEGDSLCAKLRGPRIVRLPGGHHFDGDYGQLAQRIADFRP